MEAPVRLIAFPMHPTKQIERVFVYLKIINIQLRILKNTFSEQQFGMGDHLVHLERAGYHI